MPMLVLREDDTVARATLEDYREAVYTLVQLVEAGRVVTYGCIARILGVNPRLVGRILSMNSDIIAIPCHRVVGKRSPGGFNRGVELKNRLLALEGVYNDRLEESVLLDCRDLEELIEASSGYSVAINIEEEVRGVEESQSTESPSPILVSPERVRVNAGFSPS